MKKQEKGWMIAKAVLVFLFILTIIIEPSKNKEQLFGRTLMLSVLAITFIIDLYRYNQNRKTKG